MLQPLLYEAAARLLFAPFGGLERLRARIVEACAPRAGARILEVGCGPGVITNALVTAGAQVTAVDASPEMIRLAARRAPGASVTLADARTFTPAGRFDTVLVSFVMHELPAPEWQSLARRLAAGLETTGRIVIADHAMPAAAAGRAWRWVLRTVESRRIEDWLNADPIALVDAAGLAARDDVRLAGGRVRLIVAAHAS